MPRLALTAGSDELCTASGPVEQRGLEPGSEADWCLRVVVVLASVVLVLSFLLGVMCGRTCPRTAEAQRVVTPRFVPPARGHTRTVGVQSPCIYKYWLATPRFVPLPEFMLDVEVLE